MSYQFDDIEQNPESTKENLSLVQRGKRYAKEHPYQTAAFALGTGLALVGGAYVVGFAGLSYLCSAGVSTAVVVGTAANKANKGGVISDLVSAASSVQTIDQSAAVTTYPGDPYSQVGTAVATCDGNVLVAVPSTNTLAIAENTGPGSYPLGGQGLIFYPHPGSDFSSSMTCGSINSGQKVAVGCANGVEACWAVVDSTYFRAGTQLNVDSLGDAGVKLTNFPGTQYPSWAAGQPGVFPAPDGIGGTICQFDQANKLLHTFYASNSAEMLKMGCPIDVQNLPIGADFTFETDSSMQDLGSDVYMNLIANYDHNNHNAVVLTSSTGGYFCDLDTGTKVKIANAGTTLVSGTIVQDGVVPSNVLIYCNYQTGMCYVAPVDYLVNNFLNQGLPIDFTNTEVLENVFTIDASGLNWDFARYNLAVAGDGSSILISAPKHVGDNTNGAALLIEAAKLIPGSTCKISSNDSMGCVSGVYVGPAESGNGFGTGVSYLQDATTNEFKPVVSGPKMGGQDQGQVNIYPPYVEQKDSSSTVDLSSSSSQPLPVSSSHDSQQSVSASGSHSVSSSHDSQQSVSASGSNSVISTSSSSGSQQPTSSSASGSQSQSGQPSASSSAIQSTSSSVSGSPSEQPSVSSSAIPPATNSSSSKFPSASGSNSTSVPNSDSGSDANKGSPTMWKYGVAAAVGAGTMATAGVTVYAGYKGLPKLGMWCKGHCRIGGHRTKAVQPRDETSHLLVAGSTV